MGDCDNSDEMRITNFGLGELESNPFLDFLNIFYVILKTVAWQLLIY